MSSIATKRCTTLKSRSGTHSDTSSKVSRQERRPVLFVLLSPLLLAPTAAAPSRAQEAVEVPASYRSVVSAHELASWLQFNDMDSDPGNRALESLLVTKALAAEAEATNLAQEPKVRWSLEQADLAIVWQAVQRDATERAEVTEAEAQQLASRYQTLPRRVRLRNLFKRYPADATAADRAVLREQMESLRQRVLAGESFGELAAAESQSQSRFTDGLIGNVRPGQLKPAVEKVAFALEPGEVSAVLASEEGLTLLFCEQVLEAVSKNKRGPAGTSAATSRARRTESARPGAPRGATGSRRARDRLARDHRRSQPGGGSMDRGTPESRGPGDSAGHAERIAHPRHRRRRGA